MKTICYFVNSDWYFDLHWLARALSAKHHGYEVHIITRISEEKYLRRFTELGLCCHSLPIKERSCNISASLLRWCHRLCCYGESNLP